MLLLAVSWFTVTHFSGVAVSSIFINYNASKMVQLESYQIPVGMLVLTPVLNISNWLPDEHRSGFKNNHLCLQVSSH